MMISHKQHQANIQNARKSTGPKTPEGKQAVRFNAVKNGLRASLMVLPFENEDSGEFDQLCADLEAEWQPQTYTERLLVEQMCVNQWMLRRLTQSEAVAWLDIEPQTQHAFTQLDRIGGMIARYERSFSKTVRELQHLQKQRTVSAVPQPAPEPIKPAASHPEPIPEPMPEPAPEPGVAYRMADAAALSAVPSDSR